VDDSKLQPIRDYLQRELPSCKISEKHNPGSGTKTFVISAGTHSICIKVEKSFIEYKSIDQIKDMLNRMNIMCLFKQHPDINIFVISSAPNRM
jgi:hypothetical protein